MAMPPPQTQSDIPAAPPPTPEQLAAQRARERQTNTIIAAGIVVVIVILVGLGLAVYALLQPGTPTDRIRDIFIIIVSLETLVIGVALVVLLIQLASLINLLQNEVRPIIRATNETINTLRGTAEFLGESVVEPVIKLNGYLASIQRVLELMGLKQK
jgi:ABC-type dipeptide/oligopeptide/nickel transport system permease component